MKTIGLIGGMSWESSVLYYQLINRKVNSLLGGLHSGKSILYTVNFQELVPLQQSGDWDALAQMMIDAAQSLQKAGADMVLICANTMHKVADQVQQHISIPVIHIADAVAEEIKQAGISKVGLLGTQYTMEQDFLIKRLESHGLHVSVPRENERTIVHDIIYTELTKGIIRDESRQAYLQVIDRLAAQGAQAVILGCTEIGLLIKQTDTAVKVFDTTVIHAEKAVAVALSGDNINVKNT